jgi:hypothetical protein
MKIQALAKTEKQLAEIDRWLKKHIADTYISISSYYSDCTFANNWRKE